MKLTKKDAKELIFAMGFLPEDGSNDIYYKKYKNHDNYIIKVNFNTEKIEYRSNEVKEEQGIKWGDLTTSNFENSENFVVLECINRLLQKGYAPKNLYLEYKFPLGRNEKGKLDILVFDNDGKAYLMIECKTWGTEFAKEEKKMLKDGGQLFSYFVQDKSAKYLCLYASQLDGTEIEYKNNIIKVDEVWSELNNQKEIHDHWNKNTKDNGIFEEWANAYDVEIKALVRGRLLPLTKDDSGRIFNQFAEILRHNVVSDKPNAFNKILNLFICKIIDEDKNESEQVDFQWLEDDTDESLQIRLNDLYKKGMHRFLDIDVTDFTDTEISNTLINIDDSQAQKVIKDMFIKLRLQKNPEFAFIEVYDDNSFKLNARVVREVVELLQPYQFRYGHKQQFLGDFFELLLGTSIKQEAGQFFTPVPITRYIISSLPIKEFIEKKLLTDEPEILPSVIDFACGTGHFITEFMDKVQSIIENELDINKAKPTVKKKIRYWAGEDGKFEWAKDYVYGIDADYRLVKSSKVSSFLNGDGEANIIRANGLDHFLKSKEYKNKLKIMDKATNDNGQFDILIANPPYSVNAFKSTVKYGEESFELFNKLTDSSSEIECLFIERMKQLLKVGGYAGIILPNTILNKSGIYTATRELLLKYFKIIGITEFSTNTFMATGTNTVTLFLERRSNSDHIHIQNSIKDFFEKPKDVTVLGVEHAFSKYVSLVFGDIHFSDYISFVNRKPSDNFMKHIIYQEYKKWFDSLSDIQKLKNNKKFKEKTLEEKTEELDKLFYEKVFAIEKEKMLYFLLLYPQKTILTKIGEKQDEKTFLGYEFRKTRGYEGISMLPDGTKLYDEGDVVNPQKANSYVYQAFTNNFVNIDESLSENIFTANTVKLMNFSSVKFEKIINTREDLKLTFDTTLPLDKLSTKVKLVRGVVYEKSDQVYQKTPNTILTADNISISNQFELTKEIYLKDDFNVNEEAKLLKNDIFICMSSGSRNHVGKSAFINHNLPYYAGGFMGILRSLDSSDNEAVFMKYVHALFSTPKVRKYMSEISTGTNIKNLDDSIVDMIVPIPSYAIQKDIVDSLEKIELDENGFIIALQNARKEVLELVNNLSNYDYLTLNDSLIRLNSTTIQPEKNPKKKYLYVDIDSVENGTGNIKFTKHIIGERAPSRARRIAKSNSTIISTVRPNLKAFAFIENEIEDCVFSTGFAIIESLNELVLKNKWIYYNFMYSENLMEQLINAMPKGQYPSINNNDIYNLKIRVPNIEKQNEFISIIEDLEKKISHLEKEISKSKLQKKSIIEKYLK